jgi:biopolymer transport protein ExbB/TolQ
MQPIHDLLYLLSNAFLLPTLIGTLLVFAYGTFVVGQFLSEWLDHRSNRAHLRLLYAASPSWELYRTLPWRGYFAKLRREVERQRDASEVLVKCIADWEHEMTARIERLSIVSKVGPMLGLIGTLIPLQPALAGLARGDMQAMGANLQIGFTTTVLGLIVGGTCYAVGVVMRNWFQQDVTDLYFLLNQWDRNHNHETRLENGLEEIRATDSR